MKMNELFLGVLLLFAFNIQLRGQGVLDSPLVNGLYLGKELDKKDKDIYFLSGEEEIYQKYEWLKKVC